MHRSQTRERGTDEKNGLHFLFPKIEIIFSHASNPAARSVPFPSVVEFSTP